MDSQPVPDGGYGWAIVFGSFLLNFVVVGMPRGFGVLYVILINRFHSTATETAWVHALYNTSRMLLAPVSSFLCERYTTRKVVLVGSLLVFIGVTSSAFVTSIYQMYLTFGIIAGVGGSMLFAPSLIIVGKYFSSKKGTAMGISTMGAGFGTMSFAAMFTFLINYYGYLGGILVIGSVVSHCAIAGALFRPLAQHLAMTYRKSMRTDTRVVLEKQKPLDTSTDNGSTQAVLFRSTEDSVAISETVCADDNMQQMETMEAVEEKSWISKQLMLLKNKAFVTYVLSITVMPCGIMVVYLFIAAHAEQHGVTERERALLISIQGFSDIVGRISFGFVFDLKLIRHRRRYLHSFLGILFGAATMAIAPANSFVTLVVIGVLHGIIEGAFHAQRATILSEIVPHTQLSMCVGYMTFWQGTGNLAFPVIGGQLRDHLGSFDSIFLLGGAAVAICCLVSLLTFVFTTGQTKQDCCAALCNKQTTDLDQAQHKNT